MADDGLNKSAILLMSLGEDEAAEVLKHLGPREVQKISAAIAALKSVTREQMESVLGEFCEKSASQATLGMASGDYLRNVLKKALGDDRSAPLIDRLLQSGDTSGIDGLKWMGAAAVADLIRNEHPQIIATILVHLERDQASEILAQFDEQTRSDVLLRIATLDGIQPAAMKELNDVLTGLPARRWVEFHRQTLFHWRQTPASLCPSANGYCVRPASSARHGSAQDSARSRFPSTSPRRNSAAATCCNW